MDSVGFRGFDGIPFDSVGYPAGMPNCISGNDRISGAVCYASFLHDCYSKLSGVANFSVVMCHRVALRLVISRK